MKTIVLSTIVILALSIECAADGYRFDNLSVEDVLKIGRGLGKLPREDTDQEHGNLWGRIQNQINAQEEVARKAQADAAKAVLDKAIAEAVAKEKAAAEAIPEGQKP
jgi:hypothetical protein